MKQMLFILFTLFFFFPYSCNAGSDVTLRLNLEKGSTAKYKTESSQVITQTMGGMNQVVDQSQLVEYTMLVLDKDDDGNMLTEITFNRIAIEITANGSVTKYDSNSEDKAVAINPEFMGFSAMVHKSLRTRISSLGVVDEVIGFDEMLESMISDLSAGNEVMKDQLTNMLKSNLTEKSVGLMFSGSFIQFSEKPVIIGGSWDTKVSITNQFTLNGINTYTIKGVENGVANVDYSSTMNTIPDEKISMQGIEMVFNLMGTQSGSVVIDVKTGLINESSLIQNITGNITTETGVQLLSIPLSIMSQSKTEMIE